MKNNYIKKYIGAILLLCVSAVSYAQFTTSSTGYFLEGNLYRNKLNPSFMGDQAYVSLPILGNLNMHISSNVGLANFVYPSKDGNNMITFLHPDVTADEFNSSLNDVNRMNFGVDLSLMSVGFLAFGGYNTLDIDRKSVV